MIRFKIQELMAQRQFESGKRITLIEIAESTGINRMTISRMINTKGYSTVTENLDKLCAYFDCRIEDIIEYVADEKKDV
jgi:putative transcriptional regulator